MRSTFAISKHLDAPAARVWRLITDTQSWPRWGPTVRAVDCTSRFIQAGSTGRVLTPLGIWVPFSIKAFEPERYWDWQVAGVMATGHRIEPAGNQSCVLAFTVPVWAVGYPLVCQLALNRIHHLLS
jgi:uncharacterized protein YndB with AHSA1/START domain